ncbi:hypothetical protein ABT56_15390 [Photobacterium aquae]|uniref:Uncharacterized protein n=1 Tax=Photobacterium aquae TaxID=1195763 RepID=A0A0J1GWB8_9GAMM|nr:hypothetical protein ABT56_15390 [Photobacterium aquae]
MIPVNTSIVAGVALSEIDGEIMRSVFFSHLAAIAPCQIKTLRASTLSVFILSASYNNRPVTSAICLNANDLTITGIQD